MKKLSLLILVCFLGSASYAQDEIAKRYGETILAADLKKDLLIVASDSFGGRETGKAGQRMAADYIAKSFRASGLEVQQQAFQLEVKQLDTSYIMAFGKRYECLEDFYFFPGQAALKANYKEVVFLGFGIEDSVYNDYKDMDVSGKAVVIMNGEPIARDETYLISGGYEASEWSQSFTKKIDLAESKGAAALFIVDTEAKKNIKKAKPFLTRQRTGLVNKDRKASMPAIYVSEDLGSALLMGKVKKFEKIATKIGRKAKPMSEVVKENNVDLSIKVKVEKATSTNVLGFLKGTDLADEVIVITAHYDHIGIINGQINNGADDDGSGTVAVLELARAFAEAKKNGHGPRRSILFMCVSGEEKGLLGSKYYTDNPIYPLEKTVCNLNIDMIGRVDKEHKKNPNYVYLIGSDKLSTDLHKISETANQLYTNLELDYTYNAPDDPNRFYYRSDHYNFAKNNIPVIFYFNGVHKDYHKPTDTVEKINFEKMETIGRLVFHTAWTLANQTVRIQVDVVNDFQNQ